MIEYDRFKLEVRHDGQGYYYRLVDRYTNYASTMMNPESVGLELKAFMERIKTEKGEEEC